MFACTATASARAEDQNWLAVIAYSNSRRVSSSALIAEISANTACTCSPRRSRARTAATSSAGTYRSRPRPAGRREVGIRAVRLAGHAPTVWLAAAAGLLHQRPGQHVLDLAESCREPTPTRQQCPRRQARQQCLVCIHHTNHAAARQGDQRPRIARVAAASSANPLADNRCEAAALPSPAVMLSARLSVDTTSGTTAASVAGRRR
jgi:hypothetical protein